ncbi:MAG: hypothetical protein JJU15_00640 [Pararhodobacter sp.]|nr:hypothetical protein [Pararhodobacter sp.]
MPHALSPAQIDALGEFVLERVMVPGSTPRGAVRDLVFTMAKQCPDTRALAPVLVLAIVANGLDETLNDSASPRSSATGLWRMAALVATDVMAMEGQGNGGRSIADLVAYWHTSDGFFLS